MFGINKRVITIIFGFLALAFLVGATILFAMQGGGNLSGNRSQGPTVMWVNGRPVSELELARIQSRDPLLSSNPQGLMKPLLDTFFLEKVILTKAVQQDSSRIRVSGGEVRKALDDLKQRAGATTKEQYDQLLNQIGYTDSQLRDELRDSLKVQKRVEEIQKKATPTPEEVKFYFDLNKANYKTEDRVKARQIVVDDKKLADDLYAQLKAGADFVELAKKNSKVAADQGGALGAETGKSEPGFVTRVIFPSEVADAVFKLKQGGLTAPIASGGRYYIVKVEEFKPGGDPNFEEVKDRVAEDVKKIKGDQALEAYLLELRKKTQVRFAENTTYKYENPVVAKVGESEIKLPELTQLVFTNQQIPQLIQQGLGDLAVQFFMPQALEQLITREILVSEAKKLNQPFVGARDQIAREVQAYHTKDITVTDEEVRKYYAENPASFTIPASAEVKGISFKKEDEAKAKAFREAALKGGKLEDLAKANGGTVTDYGKVNPGTLPPVANRLVFLTKGNFPKGPLGEVSEVVKLDDGSYQVLIVNNRVAEKLKPFEEVADQAREQVLAQKRSKAAQAWVAELRKQTKVENSLNKVLAEITPKETKPASSNPGSGQQTPAQSSPQNKAPAQPKQENPTPPSKP